MNAIHYNYVYHPNFSKSPYSSTKNKKKTHSIYDKYSKYTQVPKSSSYLLQQYSNENINKAKKKSKRKADLLKQYIYNQHLARVQYYKVLLARKKKIDYAKLIFIYKQILPILKFFSDANYERINSILNEKFYNRIIKELKSLHSRYNGQKFEVIRLGILRSIKGVKRSTDYNLRKFEELIIENNRKILESNEEIKAQLISEKEQIIEKITSEKDAIIDNLKIENQQIINQLIEDKIELTEALEELKVYLDTISEINTEILKEADIMKIYNDLLPLLYFYAEGDYDNLGDALTSEIYSEIALKLAELKTVTKNSNYERFYLVAIRTLKGLQRASKFYKQYQDLDGKYKDALDKSQVLNNYERLTKYLNSLQPNRHLLETAVDAPLLTIDKPKLMYIQQYGFPEDLVFDPEKLIDIEKQLNLHFDK